MKSKTPNQFKKASSIDSQMKLYRTTTTIMCTVLIYILLARCRLCIINTIMLYYIVVHWIHRTSSHHTASNTISISCSLLLRGYYDICLAHSHCAVAPQLPYWFWFFFFLLLSCSVMLALAFCVQVASVGWTTDLWLATELSYSGIM